MLALLPVAPATSDDPTLVEAQASIRKHLRLGLRGIALLFGGVGAWAATTDFAGAVFAPGLFVVDTSDKKVQHPTGGVVAALNVHDGDRVHEGDVLLRLDDTITKANLAIVTKSLAEIEARLARLEAERDGGTTIAFPDDLVARSSDPQVARAMAGETTLF